MKECKNSKPKVFDYLAAVVLLNVFVSCVRARARVCIKLQKIYISYI